MFTVEVDEAPVFTARVYGPCSRQCGHSTRVHVWNSLPVSVQNCDTLTLFKSRLKAHYFVLLRLCFLTVLFASALEATATWRFTNFVVYCIVLYCIHTYDTNQYLKLLRAHMLGARELAPPAAERIASISSHPADRQLSMSTQKLDVDGNKSPGRTMLQSTTFTEVRPAKRKTV